MAIVIPHDFKEPGVHFVTPEDYSQQLAYMNHKKGKLIEPHYHKTNRRDVHRTLETLIIKNGRIRVDFYDDAQRYVECVELVSGDVILLVQGGHGFEILEDIDMIEIKQGPFVGVEDKVRFKPVE